MLQAVSTADVKFLRFMGPVEANIPAHYIARRGDSQALHEDLYPSTPAFGLLGKLGNQPGSATTQEEPSPQANHQLPKCNPKNNGYKWAIIQMPVVESTASPIFASPKP